MACPRAERNREREEPDRVARTGHHGRGAERCREAEREEYRACETALPREPERANRAGEHRGAVEPAEVPAFDDPVPAADRPFDRFARRMRRPREGALDMHERERITGDGVEM